MVEKEINIRLTANSIQTFDDIKPWARGYEASTESRLDQIGGDISRLKEDGKKYEKLIKRNSGWLLFSVSLFGSAFVITIFLFWMSQISK